MLSKPQRMGDAVAHSAIPGSGEISSKRTAPIGYFLLFYDFLETYNKHLVKLSVSV